MSGFVIPLPHSDSLRPWKHEDWCPMEFVEHDDCTCDLEQRQAQWDRENRSPRAAELPRAIVRQHKRLR